MIPAFRTFLGAAGALALDAGDGGTVQQVDGVAPYDTTVAIRFNTDGTVETGKQLNGGGISWTSAGRWHPETPGTPGNFDVRFTNFDGSGGGDWTTEASADDVWVAISTTRTYTMNSTSAESINFDCTFETRGEGAVQGSSDYTFSIVNTT